MATAPTTLEHAAASAQQSVSITEAVAVRGGGIKLDAMLHRSWIVIPEDVDGYRFFEVHASYQCKQYLNANFRMVEELQKQRDAKAAALMRELASADADPILTAVSAPMQRTGG